MLQAATGVLTGDQIPTQQKQDLASSANEFQYSEVNFNKLVYRVLELETQRTRDLEELGRQKDKIIELYSRTSPDYSPLMRAV
jgi:hypothetical protein